MEQVLFRWPGATKKLTTDLIELSKERATTRNNNNTVHTVQAINTSSLLRITITNLYEWYKKNLATTRETKHTDIHLSNNLILRTAVNLIKARDKSEDSTAIINIRLKMHIRNKSKNLWITTSKILWISRCKNIIEIRQFLSILRNKVHRIRIKKHRLKYLRKNQG